MDAFKAGSFYLETYGRTWHKKEDANNPITKGMSVKDAMALENLQDIEVVLADTITKVPVGNDQFIELPGGKKKQLMLINVPWTDNGIQDLNRQVDWYQPIQNRDYAEILNPLADTYQVSSVFHCGTRGESFIVQFEVDPFYVQDMEEEMHRAFLTVAVNRSTGKKYFGFTIVRVVCVNTFNWAINRGLRSMPNSGDPKLLLDFEVQLEQHRMQHIGALNDLFTKKVERADVTEVANALFPAPKVPKIISNYVQRAETQGFDMTQKVEAVQYVGTKAKSEAARYERDMARRDKHLNGFFEQVDRYNDLFAGTQAAGTAYSLWQAATDHMNHTDLWKSDVATQNYNLIFGDQGKALNRAWAVLTK